jgi:hypothetical protein
MKGQALKHLHRGVYGRYFTDDEPEHNGKDMGHDLEVDIICQTRKDGLD